MKPLYCQRCGRLLDNKGRCNPQCRKAQEKARYAERVRSGEHTPKRHKSPRPYATLIAGIVASKVMLDVWRHIHELRESIVKLSDYVDDCTCVSKSSLETAIGTALARFDMAVDLLREAERQASVNLPEEITETGLRFDSGESTDHDIPEGDKL
jgi:hypothetical protein